MNIRECDALYSAILGALHGWPALRDSLDSERSAVIASQVPVSGSFRLVYLIFNTLFGLLSQEQQAECFASVARVLDPGGMFVIECFVPDLTRFDHDQRVQARSVTQDSAIIEVSVHDRARQRVTTQMVTLDGQGMHLRPVAIRYSYPAERT